MKKVLAIVISLILIVSVAVTASADFGDYGGGSDFSFDWGSDDWGGSSFDDWGGSSYDDWGSGYDDWGGSSYDSWGSSGYGYSYYPAASSGFSFEGIVTAVVIVIIVGYIVLATVRKNSGNGSKSVDLGKIELNRENRLDELKAGDPAFSEVRFLEDVGNLYVRLQNAWTAKDLTSVRTRLTSELYAKSQAQLNTMKQKGLTNYIDNISVLSTNIAGCSIDDTNEIINVILTARINDYTVDDQSGNVVSGSKTSDIFMTYYWTLIRSKGTKTREVSGEAEKTVCPNCGAPVDLNQSAQCPYCGSVLESGNYDWVLSSIKALKKQTGNN